MDLYPDDPTEAALLGLLMLACACASVVALSSAVVVIYRLTRRFIR